MIILAAKENNALPKKHFPYTSTFIAKVFPCAVLFSPFKLFSCWYTWKKSDTKLREKEITKNGLFYFFWSLFFVWNRGSITLHYIATIISSIIFPCDHHQHNVLGSPSFLVFYFYWNNNHKKSDCTVERVFAACYYSARYSFALCAHLSISPQDFPGIFLESMLVCGM